jgi:hypothetical protein
VPLGQPDGLSTEPFGPRVAEEHQCQGVEVQVAPLFSRLAEPPGVFASSLRIRHRLGRVAAVQKFVSLALCDARRQELVAEEVCDLAGLGEQR